MAAGRIRRAWTGAVAAAAVGLLLVAGLGAPAGAEDATGSISGTVTDGEGLPVAGTPVTAAAAMLLRSTMHRGGFSSLVQFRPTAQWSPGR